MESCLYGPTYFHGFPNLILQTSRYSRLHRTALFCHICALFKRTVELFYHRYKILTVDITTKKTNLRKQEVGVRTGFISLRMASSRGQTRQLNPLFHRNWEFIGQLNPVSWEVITMAIFTTFFHRYQSSQVVCSCQVFQQKSHSYSFPAQHDPHISPFLIWSP
jgi:hypothetical protein